MLFSIVVVMIVVNILTFIIYKSYAIKINKKLNIPKTSNRDKNERLDEIRERISSISNKTITIKNEIEKNAANTKEIYEYILKECYEYVDKLFENGIYSSYLNAVKEISDNGKITDAKIRYTFRPGMLIQFLNPQSTLFNEDDRKFINSFIRTTFEEEKKKIANISYDTEALELMLFTLFTNHLEDRNVILKIGIDKSEFERVISRVIGVIPEEIKEMLITKINNELLVKGISIG